MLRIDRAWNDLFQMVEEDRFDLSNTIAIRLNELVASEEALRLGTSRDDQVAIRDGEYMRIIEQTTQR